jgi:trigger factor
VDGEEIMSMNEQRLRVEGEILFGLPCPELVSKFSGAKAGDLVVLAITLPQDHPNPEYRGREANVEVSVKAVERGALPELNDEFAQNIGMGTMEQFRERIKANLLREAFVAAKQKEEDEIINTLLGRVTFEVPKGMVDSETNALVEQQRMQLARMGANQGDVMKAQLEKFRPEAAKEAERKVRWTILSQKIAEKEGIQVTNDDLAAQVEALAQTYNTTPAKIIQRIREYDGVGPMMAEILSIKVIQMISQNKKGAGATINTETESVNEDAAKIAEGK